jgi:hypothetical protein
MFSIRDFLVSGGKQTDRDLAELIRGQMLAKPTRNQREWLQGIALSLDGYRLPDQRAKAARVKSVLTKLASELLPMPPARPARK